MFGRDRVPEQTASAVGVTEVCESVEISGDPDRVWSLIQPAANAILLIGEPGEQQTVVTLDCLGDREETTIEVTAIVPGTYAVRGYPGSPNGGGWAQLSPTPTGSRLTWATRYEITDATAEGDAGGPPRPVAWATRAREAAHRSRVAGPWCRQRRLARLLCPSSRKSSWIPGSQQVSTL